MVYIKALIVSTLLIITCRGQKTTCNGNPSTDWSCCSPNQPCDVGKGDCDRDSDCADSLNCGSNNCHNDFSSPTSNWSSGADCCYDTDDVSSNCRGHPSTDWNCCSDAFPCTLGGGDCDDDSQCQGDLVCGSDNCLSDFSSTGSNWVEGADCCKEDDCKTVNVNTGCVSSATTTITVNGISSYDCPAQVDNSNWLSTDTYDDTFEITVNGDSVTVTRTDTESGWCMPLSFKCCKGISPPPVPVTTTTSNIPASTTVPVTTTTSIVPTSTTTTATQIGNACEGFGEEVTVPGTTIISKNHPNDYDNDMDCQIKIRFPAGQRISIQFLAFDIEQHSACTWDWLEIRDGDSENSNLLGSKLCGSTNPDPIESTANILTLVFHTDGSVVRTGFKIKAELATTAATTTSSPTNPPGPPGACGVAPARIVGGSEVTPYSLPWQVGLVRSGSNSPFCGGTLISDRHVLTAAHCTSGSSPDVIVGEHRVSSTADGTRHTTCRFVDHPSYNSPTQLSHDFAILHLSTPVQIGNRAVPACLPLSTYNDAFLGGKTLTVSGWGALTEGGGSPSVLHSVDIPGMTNAQCLNDYPGDIDGSMICAGQPSGGIDACQGDSGGPLTYTSGAKTYLVGVVSWGAGCARPGKAGVYSRVTSVMSWIEGEMTRTC